MSLDPAPLEFLAKSAPSGANRAAGARNHRAGQRLGLSAQATPMRYVLECGVYSNVCLGAWRGSGDSGCEQSCIDNLGDAN
jgi:hypothetical protein